ncbi:hypothetical protein [Mycobacterium sp. 155]|uniref:hypothetical protein n=1 Tax=Mycobacterium sp. 155 TaxID=1157943 RepID=UPI000374159C|nr:hypothetical protein [Mycobacterium sp. 155]
MAATPRPPAVDETPPATELDVVLSGDDEVVFDDVVSEGDEVEVVEAVVDGVVDAVVDGVVDGVVDAVVDDGVVNAVVVFVEVSVSVAVSVGGVFVGDSSPEVGSGDPDGSVGPVGSPVPVGWPVWVGLPVSEGLPVLVGPPVPVGWWVWVASVGGFVCPPGCCPPWPSSSDPDPRPGPRGLPPSSFPWPLPSLF